MNQETKTCKNCARTFAIQLDDHSFYAQLGVPIPNQCPICRWKQQLSFWIFGRFRKTTSSLSGKSIITTLPENVPFPIYERGEWISDAWDPLLYGKDYNISRPFFEQFNELRAEVPVPHQVGINNVNCEWCDDVVVSSSGNFLNNCKNCANCYFLENAENCRSVLRGGKHKDTADSNGGGNIEKSASAVLGLNLYDTISTYGSSNCRYSAYLFLCEECEYCFGCIALRKKKYCILNKQYTKEQYEEIIQRIKEQMAKSEEWGAFFPYQTSHIGYNLSLANIYFPETKEGIEKLGGKWEEAPPPVYTDAIPADTLPDAIGDTSDDIVKKRVICPETKLSYNIAAWELAFYRTQGIPLPRRHFDWRTLERFKTLAVGMNSYNGTCNLCKKEITHPYPPEWNYAKILCGECYKREVS